MRDEGVNAESPRVYVACALSSVSGEDWRLLEDDCEAIKRGIVGASKDSTPAWDCFVHAPIDHTSPSRAPSLTAREVWRKNVREVQCWADGLVAHGFKGGSCGVGQELTWAFERGLPILYVHHRDSPVSRQIRGMAELSPWFDIREFQASDHLERISRAWTVERRHVIENGPLHRAYVCSAWEPVRGELATRWELFTRAEKARICAAARTDPEEIVDVLDHAMRLSSLPGAKLVSLLSAFDVDPLLYLPFPLMGLTRDERKALEECRRRLEWGESFTHAIEFAGRRIKQRMSIAVSRDELDLEQSEAWDEIARRWRRGELG